MLGQALGWQAHVILLALSWYPEPQVVRQMTQRQGRQPEMSVLQLLWQLS